MSVWVEKVEKDYYQCNSCGTIDDLVKIRYGQIEESTSSFRMCNNCLSLIPNSQKDEMISSLKGVLQEYIGQRYNHNSMMTKARQTIAKLNEIKTGEEK